MQEKLRLDHSHVKTWAEDALNAVGATTSLTLRDNPAPPGAGDAYVRKYGFPYAIQDITAAAIVVPRGGGPPTGRYRIYSATTNTLLGTVTDNGASAFVDGAALAAAEDIYIVLDSTAGAYTVQNGDILRLTTDVDPAPPLDIILSGETVTLAGGETIVWYVASGGSTYYETSYRYGGERHAPVLNSAKYPYFEIDAALAAAAPTIEILDSETYTPHPAAAWYPLPANTTLQSSLGQTPAIASGVGARSSRRPFAVYNNANCIFVNPAGNDANPGTWQLPMLTLQAGHVAMVLAGYTNLVVGGLGCVADPVFGAQLNMTLAGVTLDADWEIVPRIDADQPVRHATAAGLCFVRGMHCNNVGAAPAIFAGAAMQLQVTDCTMNGGGQGFATSNGDNIISFCEIYSASTGIQAGAGTANLLVEHCDIHDCANGVVFIPALGNTSRVVGCLIWNITSHGIRAMLDFNPAGTGITDTTIWNCQTGINLPQAGAYNCVPRDVLIDGCTNGIDIVNGAGTITINFCSLEGCTNDWVGAGVVNENNAIAGDPLLIAPSLGIFGLEPLSPCYHGDAGAHVGMERPTIFLGGNGVSLDGIIFDGEGSWMDGVFANVTRTTLAVTWCTFRDFHGCAVDDYGAAATTGSVLNTMAERCGNGFVFSREDNTITECLIYGSGFAGIYLELTGNVVTHVSTYGGKYGIYIGASGGLAQMDNIWFGGSVYSFYSAAAIFLLWSCYDSASPDVTTTDATNINANPFFVNVESGTEDFHLRTEEGGYEFESLCKDAASDGYDMGCYLIDRELEVDAWDTYEVACNPASMPEKEAAKSQVRFENEEGSGEISAVSHRRQFTVRWDSSSAMAKLDAENVQRKMIAYLSSRIQTDENGVNSRGGLFRLHFRPREYIYPGVLMTEAQMCDLPTHGTAIAGIIDVDTATIQMAADYVWNENKGFWATIRWTALYNNGVVDAGAKTVTSAGAGWVVDEWAGYDIRQGMFYFRVLSNTATVLTLSDPENRLVVAAANFEFYLQSNHKVLRNDRWYHYLDDTDGLLRSGTYDWFIDFIVCRLTDSSIAILRKLGYREDKNQKVPSMLKFEEAGLC